MQYISAKLNVDKSGYYFIGLIGLILIGFWPSYFSKFFDGTADFTFYFHFHAGIVGVWVALLIIQPILIRKKNFILHRSIGKLSYILAPAIFISIMLLSHSRFRGFEDGWDIGSWVTFKDLFILAVAFFIAFRYRRQMDLHARGMIVTGIACIEPAVARIPLHPEYGYFITIGFVYIVLLSLIFLERNQKKGRWVFPLILCMYLFVHSVLIFNIHFGWWQTFGKWFYSLPLT